MNDIRREMREKRRAFAQSADYLRASERICGHIRALNEFKAAKNVMLYLPLAGEADVRGLWSEDKSFFVPVTSGVEITPALWRPGAELTRGGFGIDEPARPVFADKWELNFVVVPAVAFDRSGNRLGWGKGCYDRFFEGLSAVSAVAAFDFQEAESLKREPHDLLPDYIITESGCVYGKH